ncbi:MAG: hypothetical protein F6K65_22285 [Moorea sp. SIO3C2]|nr:hypothetical protein [Moorena sp. SIO3C2]
MNYAQQYAGNYRKAIALLEDIERSLSEFSEEVKALSDRSTQAKAKEVKGNDYFNRD